MALTKKVNELDKIEVYEGRYAVTRDGRIWSYPKGQNNKQGKWLSIDYSRNYPTVCLLDSEGNKKRYTVHTLVANAYCDKPEGNVQVNHINGDKTDNSASNLEWVTASENRKHAWSTGLQTATEAHIESARKAGKSRRMFTEEQVRNIRKLYTMEFTQRVIAEMFDTSQAVIQYITSGKTYSEVK